MYISTRAGFFSDSFADYRLVIFWFSSSNLLFHRLLQVTGTIHLAITGTIHLAILPPFILPM